MTRKSLHTAHAAPLIALGLLIATASRASAGAPVGVGDDPVLYWNQVLVDTLAGPPEPTGRAYAIVDTAIHDAVNATVGYKDRNYLGQLVAAGGDTRAAASVAAHNALVALDPGNAATYDAALTASLALVSNGAAKTKGIATGSAYAAAALANRANDGSFANVPYTPSGIPGHWAPTPPVFIPAVDTQWGASTPWLAKSGDQFRPAPPPALTSAEYTAAFNLSKAIGSATSTTRTPDQTFSANFWAADTGGAPWAQAAIAGAKAKGLGTLDNARLFAAPERRASGRDHLGFQHQILLRFLASGYRNPGREQGGNAATIADGTWQPLLFTPPFPSYTSAHAENAGAAAAILDATLGTSTGFCLTDAVGNRCWSELRRRGAGCDEQSSVGRHPLDVRRHRGARQRLWGEPHQSGASRVRPGPGTRHVCTACCWRCRRA